ncbi:hypothetical protein S40288_01022 [Stachybotrys chartarum IBT 40288]|nr:hypothetical protein S40288_01022 [Stachybotrys chartarum IBT 40288]
MPFYYRRSLVRFLVHFCTTGNSFAVLIFTIPWGYVADKYGRKPVILLTSLAPFCKYIYVQLICYLDGRVPLDLTCLSALHTVFGGGVPVCTALIYTIISDVLPNGSRTTAFFQVMAANITTQFLGSLLSAALMVRDPWIPMVLGLLVEIGDMATLLLIPETRNCNAISTISEPRSSVMENSQNKHSRWKRSLDVLKQARGAMSFLISDRRLLMVAFSFLVHMLFLNQDVLRQYISVRYNTSLAHATVLMSIRSGLVFLICVAILPRASNYNRPRLGPERSDLNLARISAAVIALSFLGIALAPTKLLCTLALASNSLGWGLFSFLRSLATGLVEEHHTARLNSLICIFDIVGLMIGSPLLAALFSRGVELTGFWTGLPFFMCSGVMLALLLGLVRVKV